MSTIANAQAIVGYIRATDRPACHNCPDVESKKISGSTVWYCTLCRFYVTAMAVCDAHPTLKLLAEKAAP
jgi:ribosomal protein L37AE/L43A